MGGDRCDRSGRRGAAAGGLRCRGRASAPVRGGAPDGRPLVAAGGVRAGPGPAARARARPRARARRPRRVQRPAPRSRTTWPPDGPTTPWRRRSGGRSSGSWSAPASREHWEGFLAEELALEGSDPRATSAGTLADVERCASGAPSSGPAPRAWRPRTGCARPAWRSRCSRRTATWAAPGWRTCTRAAASTSRTSSTASPSPRPTTGSRASRPSPTCWPTCRRRPRTWAWVSASASGAR